MGEPEGKASAITPMIRITTEAVNGKKFFNNGEITNRRYIRKKNFDPKTNEEHPYIYYDTKENKYIDNLPVSTRLGYIGKEVLKDIEPLIYNNTTNLEGLSGGIRNKIKNGKFLEYDKSYDASLGGFNNGDIAGYTKNSKKGLKPVKRYANDTSESVKFLNRLGLTIQPQYELSKEEQEKLKKRTADYFSFI